ncbi:MAG TPA: alkaline phosphatase family protein [Ilumatobacteraceae bacterium]
MTVALVPSTASADHERPLDGIKHLVVIYEEKHSFDNLYGMWGSVNGHHVIGLDDATPANTTQVDEAGNPYNCLLMSDVNLMSPPLSPDCSTSTFSFGGTSPTTAYHFGNAPYNIDHFIPATAATCPPESDLFGAPFGLLAGLGEPGGCTRDLVHRFYQEQYQINGGQQNRYVTGSDSAGMTMGYYDTTQLPIYQYLHSAKAPNYVVLDQFFQAAFGGSFLNHQYLVAAAAPAFPTGLHSVLDTNAFPKAYPLYTPTIAAPVDGQVTQACGLPTTVAGVACGDYAVNTVQPPFQPTSQFGAKMPLVDDTTTPLTIGDRLTDGHVSWAWYSGGWDNANGNVNGRGWTNGAGPTCGDPNSAAAAPDLAGHGGFPYCPDFSFQTHHQPLNYYARYAPGQPDRGHLKDEQDFLHAATTGHLPSVSFVKPLGNENEHPGYSSEANGSDHLVDLIKAIENGPQGKSTLIVVTYDEFGGAWDHVSPPGMGTTQGVHDLFGPGTRIPALVIGKRLEHSGVDHTVYDTTSIMRTIEAQWHLQPVAARDAAVNDLRNALHPRHHEHDGDND